MIALGYKIRVADIIAAICIVYLIYCGWYADVEVFNHILDSQDCFSLILLVILVWVGWKFRKISNDNYMQ